MNIACLSFTDKGRLLGDKLKSMESNKYKIDHYANKDVDGGIKGILKSIWNKYDGIIFLSATGMAIRMSTPFIEDKTIDPGIVVMDDLGKFSISLLSGHLGGANELAKYMADSISAIPVITTATDNRSIESIDIFAQNNGYYIEDIKSITSITSMMVNDENVGLYTEDDKIINYNKLTIVKDLNNIESRIKGLIIVGSKEEFKNINIPYTILRPKNVNIGIGCRKGVAGELIIKAIREELNKFKLSINSIQSIGTVEIKREEKGIIEASNHFNCPLKTFTIGEIKKIEDRFSKSQFVKDTIGVYSVSGPAAFLQGGKIISEKSKHNGITISISKEIKNG